MPEITRRNAITAGSVTALSAVLATPALAATGYAKATVDAAVMKYATWRSTWLTYIPAGTVVKTTGRTSGDWREVVYKTFTGWTHGSYLVNTSAPSTKTPGVRPVTKFYQRHTNGSKSSYYHVYADGIDWTKTVGVAWYFDGDQSFRDQLVVGNPEFGDMKRMGYEANRRNFVMIGVETPDYRPNGGFTWWIDRAANGVFFRSLAAKIFSAHTMLSKSRQWLTGWSGGAEFISMTLMSTQQLTWMKFGGATIIGGGDRPSSVDTTSPTFRGCWMSWHVAEDDDYTAALTGWSAEVAATAGEHQYRVSNHYYRTRLLKYPAGAGAHHSYDIPALMASDMTRAGFGALR